MSAWYVFSSTGLYPFTAADTKYIVSVPLFDEVKWQVNTEKPLIIKKLGNSRRMNTITINNKNNNGYFVSYDVFKNGGTLEVTTK